MAYPGQKRIPLSANTITQFSWQFTRASSTLHLPWTVIILAQSYPKSGVPWVKSKDYSLESRFPITQKSAHIRLVGFKKPTDNYSDPKNLSWSFKLITPLGYRLIKSTPFTKRIFNSGNATLLTII